jgi:hypothetical protein
MLTMMKFSVFSDLLVFSDIVDIENICLFFCLFETGSYVAQAGLEAEVLPPPPPECWDYRCAAHL